jgi:hypothetical protein
MKILPTSFSALDSFETCPRKHFLTRISKQVKEPPSEVLTWGNTVHKALEKYLRDGTPLPKTVKPYQPYADKIKKKFDDATLLVENQLSVTDNFEPTGWWDDSGWFRGVIDVAIVRGDKAHVFDWKTGSIKDNFDQLHMFAALITCHYPEVETISASFVWLKDRDLTNETYTRDEARKFWAGVVPRIERLKTAFNKADWPPKPSGLCRRHCPVGKNLCEYCGG